MVYYKELLAEPFTFNACTKVAELVAESISYLMVGKKLPKPIEDLVAKTIAYAKANKNPTVI